MTLLKLISLTTRSISNLSAIPNPVDSIDSEEFLYEDGSSVFVGASISWNHDRQNVSEIWVQYRIDNDNFETVQTASPSVTFRTCVLARWLCRFQLATT